MAVKIELQRYDVQVLGRHFHIVGQMEPIGQLMDFLNRGQRQTFSLYDAKLAPLKPAGPLNAISRPHVILNADELGLIYFLDAEYRQRVSLLKQFDEVIAYTPHAVLRGRFHRGAETRLSDLLDMAGVFLAMSNVSIFALRPLPGPFPQQADLLIVNQAHVQFYHAQ